MAYQFRELVYRVLQGAPATSSSCDVIVSAPGVATTVIGQDITKGVAQLTTRQAVLVAVSVKGRRRLRAHVQSGCTKKRNAIKPD
ncbi:hypothetical protein L915_21551 [Phytophthora nicotianae]|uniref:Uncharacterized protein n=1 Tax=Phytophthora nicotianae TaxID=4792 RepID=W2FK44_PHYNI|nr:hypothetical protein L915_21551 [Phytophthora nicotianae]